MEWLATVFFALMGLAMLIYVVLDGFDLGIGILLLRAESAQRDQMIASIGPFWDANETWLVLGIGILLIAFPIANSVILARLYLPVTFMLLGLVLRGAAFDFRVKVHADYKTLWDKLFFAGSLLASLSQGWMLGRWISGFADGWGFQLFALLTALALPATYIFLGAAWLLIKSERALQQRALPWLKQSWLLMIVGIAAISIITPIVSAQIAQRWFSLPAFFILLPIPLLTALTLLLARWVLNSTKIYDELAWLPFACAVVVLFLCFCGLAYSVFPYIVIEQLTLSQAALNSASLLIIFIGVVITLPVIIAYTLFSYRVFAGKAQPLTYG